MIQREREIEIAPNYIKHIKYGVVRGVVKNKIIDFIDILKKGEYKPGTDERNDEEFGF